jgi:Zn-dependent oligopeptidase
MTDWNLMTEYIHNAMYELDKAQAATRQVQENATPETLDKFLAQMQELTENLTNLQTVLNHQEDLALDKFADWLSKEFTVKLSEYRYTPRPGRIVLSAGPE